MSILVKDQIGNKSVSSHRSKIIKTFENIGLTTLTQDEKYIYESSLRHMLKLACCICQLYPGM